MTERTLDPKGLRLSFVAITMQLKAHPMAKTGQSKKVIQRVDGPHLSDRERTVLLLAADGLTDKEIARNLGISLKTVGTYWDRMRHKFSASSRTQVLANFLRIQVAEDQEAGRLDRLFATWEEGVWIVGREGQTHYANERVSEILNTDCQAITDRKPTDVLGSANAPKIRRLLTGAKSQPHTIEILAGQGGDRRWLNLRAAPFEDDRGRLGATVILVKDITVRKRVEHALQTCESSLLFLVDKSSDLVAKFDAEMRLVYVNESFCKMLRVADSQMVGKHVTDLETIFAPNARWIKGLDRALRTGQSQRFMTHLAGIKGRLVANLLAQPSGDFAPSSVISLTRSQIGPIIARK